MSAPTLHRRRFIKRSFGSLLGFWSTRALNLVTLLKSSPALAQLMSSTKRSFGYYYWGYEPSGFNNSKPILPTTVMTRPALSAASPKTASGNGFTLILFNQTLWAWGANSAGQLGISSTANQAVPTQVGAANTWVTVDAGDAHSAALTSAGSLFTWGQNGSGQLGHGSVALRSSPVQVAGSSYVSLACGSYHTMAIQADSTLYAWGYNVTGQLGIGNTASKSAPVQVPGSWSQVAGGSTHSLGIRSDGSLWAWGSNTYGELGVGNTTYFSSPVQVSAASWLQIGAGAFTSLALRSDGTLWAWGNNTNYVVSPTGPSRSSPVQIPGSWLQVAVGSAHVVATRSDRSTWAWGSNSYGELGQGATGTSAKSIAVQVAGLWVGLSAGTNSSTGFRLF